MMAESMKKLLGSDKSRLRAGLLVFCGALGLFLLISGSGSGKKKQQATAQPLTVSQASLAYTEQLEKTLTQLVGSIQGAGKVQVAVTLEASAETVYALDQKEEGNERREVQHILVDTEGGQDALVEMTWEPVIRGIAIVCEGAGEITVNAQITEAVSVLAGVSTNRISIAKMS